MARNSKVGKSTGVLITHSQGVKVVRSTLKGFDAGVEVEQSRDVEITDSEIEADQDSEPVLFKSVAGKVFVGVMVTIIVGVLGFFYDKIIQYFFA